ncbi:MAG: phosphatase PAP2 family protein [Sinimarinibacterium sp.]|jgi:membrane-associated phospholipid phosphatase
MHRVHPAADIAPRHADRRRSLPTIVCAILLAAFPLLSAAESDSASGNPSWTKSGDLLQWGIPLFGFGLTFLLDGDGLFSSFQSNGFLEDAGGLNWPGPRLGRSPQQDFLISFARMEVATYGLKYSLNSPRPNGGKQGFPSGHTAAAFMGAEFIRKQYGPWWGTPAYAAASWVGYTRVNSHNHFWVDVIGGALVGIASNYDFDSVETPVGRLSFGPSTFVSGLGAISQFDDPLALQDADWSSTAVGLRFELQF